MFVRHQGERAAQKLKDQQEAELLASVIRQKIACGEFDLAGMKARADAIRAEKAKAVTLREYFNKTLSPLWEASLSPSTFKNYSSSFKVHILPALGDRPLRDITRTAVKAFVIGDLKKKPVARSDDSVKARLLSKNTIRLVVATLRSTA